MVQPGFQQRAMKRLQLPENKKRTERRLTEYIAAQQEQPAKPNNLVNKASNSEAPEPIFVEQDPRLIWTQPQSPAWYAAKQAEINRRPGRKARMGRAAESLRMQLRQDGRTANRDRIEDLPQVIRQNEEWMAAMAAMGWLDMSDKGAQDKKSAKRKSKGPATPSGGYQ